MKRSWITWSLAWAVFGGTALLTGPLGGQPSWASSYHPAASHLSQRLAAFVTPPAASPLDAATAEAYSCKYGYQYASSGSYPTPVTQAQIPPLATSTAPYDFSSWDLSGYEGAMPNRAYGRAVLLSPLTDTPTDQRPVESFRPETTQADADEPEATDMVEGPEAMKETTPVSTPATSNSKHLEIRNTYRYEFFLPAGEESSPKPSPAPQPEQSRLPAPCRWEAFSGCLPCDPSAYLGYDHSYGNVYDVRHERRAPERGLELFVAQPGELLTTADQELLRTLAALLESPSGTRRARLNEHLEALGSLAIDFVLNFEETANLEVLGMADDLPAAAALLATYRLLERGELGQDESVDLLRRSLRKLPEGWSGGLQAIVRPETSPARGLAAISGHQVSIAMLKMALAPVYRASATLGSYAQLLPPVNWLGLLEKLQAQQSAQQAGLGLEGFQR